MGIFPDYLDKGRPFLTQSVRVLGFYLSLYLIVKCIKVGVLMVPKKQSKEALSALSFTILGQYTLFRQQMTTLLDSLSNESHYFWLFDHVITYLAIAVFTFTIDSYSQNSLPLGVLYIKVHLLLLKQENQRAILLVLASIDKGRLLSHRI